MESAQNPQADRGGNGHNGKFRRGIYILPSLFTVGTLVCGYFAILASFRGSELAMAGAAPTVSGGVFDSAAKAIGLAILFDGFDGRIARMMNSSSNFGREFDSLADIIAFGVAPAILAFAWGVRGVLDAPAGPDQMLRKLAWVITFAFVICGAARLARFNIDSVKPVTDRRFFIGLPIPAGAGVIAAVVHWHKDILSSAPAAFTWLGVVAALSFLMVSRLRYYSFKTIDLRRRRPYIVIILLGVAVWAIWAFSEPALFTIALVYALSGIVLRVVSRVRPHPPAPKKVHVA